MPTHRDKPNRKKPNIKIPPQKKIPLTQSLTEFCKVKIHTTKPEEDYMDVTLSIEFLNGRLKGMKYKLNIDLEDYHEVW